MTPDQVRLSAFAMPRANSERCEDMHRMVVFKLARSEGIEIASRCHDDIGGDKMTLGLGNNGFRVGYTLDIAELSFPMAIVLHVGRVVGGWLAGLQWPLESDSDVN